MSVSGHKHGRDAANSVEASAAQRPRHDAATPAVASVASIETPIAPQLIDDARSLVATFLSLKDIVHLLCVDRAWLHALSEQADTHMNTERLVKLGKVPSSGFWTSRAARFVLGIAVAFTYAPSFQIATALGVALNGIADALPGVRHMRLNCLPTTGASWIPLRLPTQLSFFEVILPPHDKLMPHSIDAVISAAGNATNLRQLRLRSDPNTLLYTSLRPLTHTHTLTELYVSSVLTSPDEHMQPILDIGSLRSVIISKMSDSCLTRLIGAPPRTWTTFGFELVTSQDVYADRLVIALPHLKDLRVLAKLSSELSRMVTLFSGQLHELTISHCGAMDQSLATAIRLCSRLNNLLMSHVDRISAFRDFIPPSLSYLNVLNCPLENLCFLKENQSLTSLTIHNAQLPVTKDTLWHLVEQSNLKTLRLIHAFKRSVQDNEIIAFHPPVRARLFPNLTTVVIMPVVPSP